MLTVVMTRATKTGIETVMVRLRTLAIVPVLETAIAAAVKAKAAFSMVRMSAIVVAAAVVNAN